MEFYYFMSSLEGTKREADVPEAKPLVSNSIKSLSEKTDDQAKRSSLGQDVEQRGQ